MATAHEDETTLLLMLPPVEGPQCTELAPCEGLRVLLELSCAGCGGLIGLEAGAAQVVAFSPAPDHREKGVAVVLRYCPCCGVQRLGYQVVSKLTAN